MLAEGTLDSHDKYALSDDFVKKAINAQVAMDKDQSDCEITGIIVKTSNGTEQSISADVIAQIDFEIAKSLKAAFSKIDNFGLENTPNVGSNNCFLQNKKTDIVENIKPSELKHTDKLKETDGTTKITYRMPDTLLQKTTSVSKEITDVDEIFQEESLPLSFKDTLQKTGKCCVNGILKSIATEDGQQAENHSISEDLPDSVKEDGAVDKGEKVEDDVVWICFICAKGFADQSKLMLHQDICEKERKKSVDDLLKPSVFLQDNRMTIPVQETRVAIPTKISESEAKRNSPPPVPTLLRKVGSSLKSLPLGIPTKRKDRQPRTFTDIYIPPSRNVYFESLGLFSTPSVEAIYKSPRKSVSDDDCQIIDLTVDDTPHAVPLTPRTRSMLSQLSRDDSNGRRRHLSFSQSTHQSATQKETSVEKELSEDSECSTEESIQKHKVPSKSAILGIPLTSPLGQRLKKHWKYENKVPIVGNIEHFCKTNDESIFTVDKKEKKNQMVEKLRNRPPPQCTFRFTKKYMNKWFHLYKFNKHDRKEFKKRIKFGLDRVSRLKLKKMKPCKVVMAKVSKKDILYWTTPRPKTKKRALTEVSISNELNRQYRFSQMQVAMASPNIVQSRRVPVYNQLIQPGPFIRPTPQLLVRTVAMGGQGMRLQVLPIQQTQPQPPFLPSISGLRPVTPQEVSRSQKRKQVFNNVREDDNMVICLSSDDEDEVIKQAPKQQCSMCKLKPEDCPVHGKRKIGPASFMRQQSRNNESVPVVDMKSSTHPNIIHSKPINTGQTVQYQNTASARVFGQFNTQSVIVPLSSVSNSSQPNQNDNKVSVVTHVSGNDYKKQDSNTSVQCNVENTRKDSVKNEANLPENDYMDYEVICIDSDDEGD